MREVRIVFKPSLYQVIAKRA